MTTEYQPGISLADARAKTCASDIYKLSSNENPFGPSPKALVAIRDHLDDIDVYPQRTDDSTRKALAAYYQRRYGNRFGVEHVVTANGACELIYLIQLANFQSRNSVVICPPAFGVYKAAARSCGAHVIEAPLDRDDFSIDIDLLAECIREDTRLVYVCNPNNPTGSYFGDRELTRILDILPAHALLVYDEVYFHFATEFELPDAIEHVLSGHNLVVLHSFSKAYGLAGLRLGYAVAAPERIASITAVKRPFHLSNLSMAAMEAAIEDDAYVEKTVDNNTRQRRWMHDALIDLGIRVWPSQANFLMFACPPRWNAKALVDRLLTGGVMVRAAFDLPNHVRVSVATPEANHRFIDVMHDVVKHTPS